MPHGLETLIARIRGVVNGDGEKSQAQEISPVVEFYFDSNIGIAFVGDLLTALFLELLCLGEFGGCPSPVLSSKLKRGLAFPTIATGKVGVGIQRFKGGPSGTIGLRLWPLHAYYQQTIPTRRCERPLSKFAQRWLRRMGKDRQNLLCSDWYFTLEAGTYGGISFESLAIVSVGHRLFFN